jgi:hypothetical protein
MHERGRDGAAIQSPKRTVGRCCFIERFGPLSFQVDGVGEY